MNERQRRFCEEYLIDLDAKRAALRAGYTPATAHHASEWIHPQHPQRPELRREIDRRLAERSRRTGVNGERVVRELARIAFADVTDVVDADGELRGDLTRDDTAALAGVKCRQTRDGAVREVRMHDKNRALELLGKHLGLFNGDAQPPQELPVIIDDAGEGESDGTGED